MRLPVCLRFTGTSRCTSLLVTTLLSAAIRRPLAVSCLLQRQLFPTLLLSSSARIVSTQNNEKSFSNHRKFHSSISATTNNSNNMNDPSKTTTSHIRLEKSWSDQSDLSALTTCVLPLSSSSHKGSSGRVAVLGGSADYTGAPYYAAMAALKTGSDLAYVFTAQEAAAPIKCYSPELMVVPVYSAEELDTTSDTNKTVQKMVERVKSRMERLHCLIIGPGLGRSPLVFRAVAEIIQYAVELNLFLVLDADALFMLSLPEYRGMLRGYAKAVLTPNVVEWRRLLGDDNDNKDDLAGVTVIQKGAHDVICSGRDGELLCTERGGLKRSGGIGDILAGTVGTLVAWHVIQENEKLDLACWTACCFVKQSTRIAFEEHGRSMTAPDVLNTLGPTIHQMTSTTKEQI